MSTGWKTVTLDKPAYTFPREAGFEFRDALTKKFTLPKETPFEPLKNRLIHNLRDTPKIQQFAAQVLNAIADIMQHEDENITVTTSTYKAIQAYCNGIAELLENVGGSNNSMDNFGGEPALTAIAIKEGLDKLKDQMVYIPQQRKF